MVRHKFEPMGPQFPGVYMCTQCLSLRGISKTCEIAPITRYGARDPGREREYKEYLERIRELQVYLYCPFGQYIFTPPDKLEVGGWCQDHPNRCPERNEPNRILEVPQAPPTINPYGFELTAETLGQLNIAQLLEEANRARNGYVIQEDEDEDEDDYPEDEDNDEDEDDDEYGDEDEENPVF